MRVIGVTEGKELLWGTQIWKLEFSYMVAILMKQRLEMQGTDVQLLSNVELCRLTEQFERDSTQVDQLVFEDLMREQFPKLVNHLDYLGVQFGEGEWDGGGVCALVVAVVFGLQVWRCGNGRGYV
ncbi:hypothetical protein Droror1_Dr00020052 [Drosera rotundifolia]